MTKNNKKPSLVGFKPSEEEYKMIVELVEHYQKTIFIPGVKMSNSDVLKIAVANLYKEKIKKK